MVGGGSEGRRERDGGEVVEDEGGCGGGDGGNIFGGVIGSVGRGGYEDVDAERRMASEDEPAKLYHGDQVAYWW